MRGVKQMPAKPIDPLDTNTWKYDYIKSAMAIYPIVPAVKRLINESDSELVIVFAEDLIKEMGPYFKDRSFVYIYNNLRHIMFIFRISVKSGFHTSGKRVFILRFLTYKDKISKSWKKRIRTIRNLMKSAKWKETYCSLEHKYDSFEIQKKLCEPNMM